MLAALMQSIVTFMEVIASAVRITMFVTIGIMAWIVLETIRRKRR